MRVALEGTRGGKEERRRTADGDDALGLLYSELRLNWRRSRGRAVAAVLSSHMSAVDDCAEINAETTYSGSVPEAAVIAGPHCIALSWSEGASERASGLAGWRCEGFLRRTNVARGR